MIESNTQARNLSLMLTRSNENWLFSTAAACILDWIFDKYLLVRWKTVRGLERSFNSDNHAAKRFLFESKADSKFHEETAWNEVQTFLSWVKWVNHWILGCDRLHIFLEWNKSGATENQWVRIGSVFIETRAYVELDKILYCNKRCT